MIARHRDPSAIRRSRAAASCLVGALVVAAAVAPGPARADDKARAELREFVGKMRHLPEPQVSDKPEQTGSGKTWEEGGDQVVATPFRTQVSVDQLAGFNPNQGVLWPGALVQGKSLAGGTLAAVAVPHAPQTVFVATVADGGRNVPVSKVVDRPSAAAVEQARQDLLRGGLFAPAKLSYSVRQFYSLDHAMIQIGARAHWLTGSVSAALNSNKYESQTNIMVYFTQEYYTYAVEPPPSPDAYFRDGVRVANLASYADQAGNPLTYVQSVTYGRTAMLLVSSKKSFDELNVDVKASLDYAAGGGDASAMVAAKRLAEESEMSLVVFGGRADQALRVALGNPLEELQKWIAEPTVPETVRYGVPISYRLNYLSDNLPARLTFTTDYQQVRRMTIPQLTKWKIKFITKGEGKDGDTTLDVYLCDRDQPNQPIMTFHSSTKGNKFYDEGKEYTEDFDTPTRPILARDVGRLQLRIVIGPHGNNTWKFRYELSADNTTGGTYKFTEDRDITLSDEHKEYIVYSLGPIFGRPK
jgi:hypothetical protein